MSNRISPPEKELWRCRTIILCICSIPGLLYLRISHLLHPIQDCVPTVFRLITGPWSVKWRKKKAYDLSCSGLTVALYWSSCLLVDTKLPCVFDGLEIWLKERAAPEAPPATRATFFNKVIVFWIYAVWRGLTWKVTFVNGLLREVGLVSDWCRDYIYYERRSCTVVRYTTSPFRVLFWPANKQHKVLTENWSFFESIS